MSRTPFHPSSQPEAKSMRASPRSITPLALALALAIAAPLAAAQTVSGDQRFTPVLGQASPLYPQSPESRDRAPQPLYAQPGNVDYSVNAGVDRVVVDVDRDGVPADGQSPVKVVVQLYGEDGKPMAGESFATIEHSGGRIKLPDGRTDELGPGRLDADDVTPGIQLAVRDGRAEF